MLPKNDLGRRRQAEKGRHAVSKAPTLMDRLVSRSNGCGGPGSGGSTQGKADREQADGALRPVFDVHLPQHLDASGDRGVGDGEVVASGGANRRHPALERPDPVARAAATRHLIVAACEQPERELLGQVVADRNIDVERVAASIVGGRVLAVELEADGAREIETEFRIEPGQRRVDVRAVDRRLPSWRRTSQPGSLHPQPCRRLTEPGPKIRSDSWGLEARHATAMGYRHSSASKYLP